MKKNRIIWLVSFIISIILMSFYGGVVSYGLVLVLAVIPVISLLYIFFVILRFRIYQKLDGRDLVAGQRSDFYFTLQNESLIGFAGIRVVFYSDWSTITGLDDATEYELLPRSGIKKQTEIVCRYRGEYEVGIRKIVVTDPLRMFSIAYNNKEPLRVRVRPGIVSLSDIGSSAEIITASRDSRSDDTEPDVLVREYVPGDDRRMIHQRATAASGKLMVRGRIGQERSGVAIIMDPSRQSREPKEYIPVESNMLESLISLVLYHCSRNIRAFVHCGSYTSQISDMAGFEAFYEQICTFDFESDTDRVRMCNDILRSETLSDCKDVFLIMQQRDEVSSLLEEELTKRGLSVCLYVAEDKT